MWEKLNNTSTCHISHGQQNKTLKNMSKIFLGKNMQQNHIISNDFYTLFFYLRNPKSFLNTILILEIPKSFLIFKKLSDSGTFIKVSYFRFKKLW